MTDSLHAHEALHTTHVLICTFTDHVTDSAFVQAHPDLVELAKKAEQSMAALYQAIGAKHD